MKIPKLKGEYEQIKLKISGRKEELMERLKAVLMLKRD